MKDFIGAIRLSPRKYRRLDYIVAAETAEEARKRIAFVQDVSIDDVKVEVA